MATVTGSVKDIVGAAMADRVARLVFELSEPSIQAASTTPGVIHPTVKERVAPTSTGTFTVNLIATTALLNDVWYTLTIEWLDASMPSLDAPDWQIRVPVAGGVLSDLISIGPRRRGDGGARPNLSLVWVSLTAPPRPASRQLWLKQDPDDPNNPANTGKLYEWR